MHFHAANTVLIPSGGILAAPPGGHGPSSVVHDDVGIIRAAARRKAAGGGVGDDGLDVDGRIVSSDDGNNNGEDALLCRLIASALDHSTGRPPDVVYHKDRLRPPPGDDPDGASCYDHRKFSSVEEDDGQARSTINEFNKLRREILTPKLLDLGVSTGRRRVRAARAFAGRLRTLLEGVEGGGGGGGRGGGRGQQRPLIITVFGTSFTIGSNCGESSSQPGYDCAWPMRLARRFDDIFLLPRDDNNSSAPPVVEWRMYQENAQGSNNIAQKIPSFVDEFRDRNVTPDAILLDNSMIDVKFGMEKPWFEAIVRVFLQTYPDVVIVSLVDAVPSFVDVPGNYDYNYTFAPWLRRIQEHYGLVVVDIAKMVRHMRLYGYDSGGGSNRDIVRDSIDDYRHRQRRQHPKVPSWHSLKRWLVRRGIISGAYSNEDSAIIDLLWPQSTDMITPNGTIMHNLKDDFDYGEVYWLNFLPMSRKTKWAWHPQNHPPWATHQYVADAVMHALMRVANVGSGCTGGRQDDEEDGDDDPGGRKRMGVPSLPEEAVSPRETLNDCFICRSPLTRIDAKSPENAGGRSVANLTDSTFTNNLASSEINDHRADVAVTCGDWHWITDGRNRSGWQSDQRGSLMRFRMKVNSDTLPTFSMTYMKSHKTFGSLMVTFRTVSRKEVGPSSPTSLLLGCNDVSKFRDVGWKNEPERLNMMDNATLIPSLELGGHIPQYSLWETVVFPAIIDTQDVVAARPWYLLNRTVLSRMMITDSNNEDAVEFVDLYVMNPKGRRIKVQVVTSC